LSSLRFRHQERLRPKQDRPASERESQLYFSLWLFNLTMRRQLP
jgi:hypothetical protein